jgi:SAM-dependent methyltransferase
MASHYNEITSCEVCGSTVLKPVLNLGLHPMCDDLVPIGDSRQCKEYPIEILFCANCTTAHQRFQVPKQDLFPEMYHYRARFTADVLRGMESLVDVCETQFGSLAGKNVVDIGCNDGSLLNFFRARGAITIGIEPTGAARDARAKGHDVYNAFLSADVSGEIVAAHGKADFITFTNVFAHIEHLGEVFDALRVLMKPETVLVIENHYLGAVLSGNQFDTFYHEHPRTYSLTSFEHVARALGISVLQADFPARYGGNVRVFLGDPDVVKSALPAGPKVDERQFEDQFAVLAGNMERWRSSKRKFIETYVRQHGALRAKAFPGRAAILITLLGLDENLIASVHEKPGSMKIGHYVPGTRIPILSDDALFAGDLRAPLLNLAWHIPKEIRSYLAQHHYTGEVIDIIGPEDFKAS